MPHPDIAQAFQALDREGKTPSLALLKARLGHSVPLPLLIQSLKQFKQDPAPFLTVAVTPPEAQADQAGSSPPGDITLERLFDEIRALRQEVNALRKQLNTQ